MPLAALCSGGWMDWGIDGWVVGWMDGWVDGWIGGWTGDGWRDEGMG